MFELLYGIPSLVAFVYVLRHALANNIKDKELWIAISILGGLIGSAIYYIAVVKNIEKYRQDRN